MNTSSTGETPEMEAKHLRIRMSVILHDFYQTKFPQEGRRRDFLETKFMHCMARYNDLVSQDMQMSAPAGMSDPPSNNI
jgi:hypothetical protein